MEIRLNRGLNLRLPGAAGDGPVEERAIVSIGLSGLDYPEIRPDFLVKQGDRVDAGQQLLRDRRRPDIAVTSPVTGVVTGVTRRDPETAAFLIRLAGVAKGPAHYSQLQERPDGDSLRAILLETGLWTTILERPFGRIPDPEYSPSAILITATRADALSPNPAQIIGQRKAEFEEGLIKLALLTDGPVWVCQHTGPPLGPASVAFSGDYPAGLAGTHVHHLYQVDRNRRVWTIGYQDVIAIGRLFKCGQLETDRTVALAGPGIRNPCLVRTPVGAAIDELTHSQLRDGSHELISGPALSGRQTQYLGRAHLQVSVLGTRGRDSRWPLQPNRRVTGPIIPVAGHQQTFPFDLPAVPLLRALAVGDAETAGRLGALELIEEDVAVLSYVCPSGNDYAPLLRGVLDELKREM